MTAPRIQLVGPPAETAELSDALADSAGQLQSVTAASPEAAPPDLSICSTPEALHSVAAVGTSHPVCRTDGVVPTAASLAELPAVIEAWHAGEAPRHLLRTYGVHAGSVSELLTLDLVLSTDAVAQISEFRISHAGTPLLEHRADGVTVATPLGTGGYAAALGGPRLGAVDALVVVPMAAFAAHTPTWVTPPPVEITMLRQEAAVSLSIDATTRHQIDPTTPIELRARDTLTVIGRW